MLIDWIGAYGRNRYTRGHEIVSPFQAFCLVGARVIFLLSTGVNTTGKPFYGDFGRKYWGAGPLDKKKYTVTENGIFLFRVFGLELIFCRPFA